jgi:hypothetical protein
VGAVLAWWVLTVLWRTRSARATLTTPGLALAVAAGVATAGAAPADAAWHAAFDRDSVLWSPPHLLSVIGTAVLVVAILLGSRGAAPARVALAAVLLGAAEIVVLEYETDVPQFSEALYLPVLLAVALGTAWIIHTLVPDPTALALTVLGYVVFRVAILVAFTIAGWTVPDLPLALLGLLLLDARLGRARWPLAGLAVVALQLAASAVGLSSVAVRPTLLAAVFVVPLLVAVLVVVTYGRAAQVVAVLAVFVVSSWFTAPSARAHDPGQGEEVATAQLTAEGDGDGTIFLRVTDIRDTEGREWTAERLVARRAGQTVTASLTGHSTQFGGEIVLPSRGLWIVYAELRAGGTAAETWLPIQQDEPRHVTERRSVYVPAGVGERPAGEFVAGGALLAVGASLIGWAGVAVRRRTPDGHTPKTVDEVE